ncbi:MAG: hypothetical protein AB8G14_15140 [Ilumatobacter sp.]
MKIDERLRRVLAERAASARVAQHPWNRVQPEISRRAVRYRTRRRRAVGLVAAAITAVAAAAVVAARLFVTVVGF